MTQSERKKQILDAVEKLAARKKLYEITLDEVARSAKVGKGTIYKNFTDKDDLFFQMAVSGFDELCELIDNKSSQKIPYQKKLLNACREINSFFGRRKQMFNIIQSETAKALWAKGELLERWFQHKQKLIKSVAIILEEGKWLSVIRNDISSEVMAAFLLDMLRTRGRDLHEHNVKIPSFEVLIDLFLNGVGVGEGFDENMP
ncbi:MAG: TetR/AcrR family transcriptional regulator [Sedimentisphaerales bacterium]|nr:TetR/AcrR family transcriptional regulator [Sedimentisphaerales bacterium]